MSHAGAKQTSAAAAPLLSNSLTISGPNQSLIGSAAASTLSARLRLLTMSCTFASCFAESDKLITMRGRPTAGGL